MNIKTTAATLVLGVQFGNGRLMPCYVPVEFNPDDVFRAANRIDTWQADADALPTDWQRYIRRKLDRLHLPSMSVMDKIIVFTPRHTLTWVCEMTGWSQIIDEPIGEM
jgi:hypothetical protein